MRAVLKTSNRYCGPAAVSILTGVEAYADACRLHGIDVQRPLDGGASVR